MSIPRGPHGRATVGGCDPAPIPPLPPPLPDPLEELLEGGAIEPTALDVNPSAAPTR